MPMRGHPLDWLQGNPKLERKFLVVVLCLLVCLYHGHFACYFESFFRPSSPDSGKFWVCRYSTDCISVFGLLLVAAARVTVP